MGKINNIQELKDEGKRLQILSHPLRLKILDYIKLNQPVFVSQIYKDLGLEQSVTSNQLGYLRKAGFLNTAREGKKVYYTLNSNNLTNLLDSVGFYFSNAK